MNNYAKDHWIPVEISLPDNHRIVQMQIAELPDPTIGSYWDGVWKFEEKDYDYLKTFTPLAWREMAEPYREEDEEYLFRTADEARTLSFNSLLRMRRGNPNQEFFDTRERILHATTLGQFEVILENISQNTIEGLEKAGYSVTQRKQSYVVSWK